MIRTAYRLLSTRAEPPAPITVHTEPQTATEAGQSTSRPLSAEYPPPPAYEELAKSFVLNDRDELESCHDVDDVHRFPSPASPLVTNHDGVTA